MVYVTGGELLLFDDFEYIVDRDDFDAASAFLAQGIWTGVKTEQAGEDGANGWLYTVDAFPGYVGAFPGNGSNRVLAVEARPGTEGSQTDFYLEYGDTEDAAYDNSVPGDVWFQFWIYINHFGDQLSQINSTRNKFIYPCNGSYPCQTGKWLMGIGNASFEPHWENLGDPSILGGFLTNAAQVYGGIGEIVCPTCTDYDNRNKLGHTDVSEYMAANRWTLVKVHLDTSTTSARYEAWMRPARGSWLQVIEWVDGVTPTGFSWTIAPDSVGGHRGFRMPTTFGQASPQTVNYDAWIYVDDFAMATSDAALPVYP